MTNSFLTDLFELNLGQFNARYGGPLSEGEFSRLKALAASGNHSKLISSFSGVASTYSGADLSAYIITKITVTLVNAGALTVNDDILGSLIDVDLLNTALTTVTFDNMETSGSLIGSLVLTVTSGTPSVFIAIYGYTPPP